MANDDKIYLAYSGELGERAKTNAKMRIDWIIKNLVDAETVLDIGCSQGIVSILAAENGKTVKGIDIQIESVAFAKKLLNDKYAHLKERVTFECVDFFEYTGEELYDCVIITEVLEHLENPSVFLEKAKKNLKKGGKVILSVPFGVAPHPDHKATYYLTNFVSLVEKFFSISRIEYMERWMGTVLCNDEQNNNFLIDKKQVELLEENFEKLDKTMSDRIKGLYQRNQELNQKYKESCQKYKESCQKYKESCQKYKESCQKNKENQQKVRECEQRYKESEHKLKENERKLNESIQKYKESEQKLKDALYSNKEKDATIKSLEWEAGQYRKIRYSFLGKLVAKIIHLFRKIFK